MYLARLPCLKLLLVLFVLFFYRFVAGKMARILERRKNENLIKTKQQKKLKIDIYYPLKHQHHQHSLIIFSLFKHNTKKVKLCIFFMLNKVKTEICLGVILYILCFGFLFVFP